MKPNGIDEDFNLHGRYAGAISFLKVDWIRNTLTRTCVEAYQSYQHGNQSILPTWERINPTNTRTNQSYLHKNQSDSYFTSDIGYVYLQTKDYYCNGKASVDGARCNAPSLQLPLAYSSSPVVMSKKV